MNYTRHTWYDYYLPEINAAHLIEMESGIENAQGDVLKLYGLTAAIPASNSSLVGRLYIESDGLLRWWRDNGASWDMVFTP